MGEELKFCSNCKKSVSRANFTVHNVHCQKNVIKCSLCHESVIKSHYQQHIENAHSSIACQQCGIQVEALNLFSHQSELCTQRLLTCQFCELDVKACEAEKHFEVCGARTDRCKGCTKCVQFKYLQFHYENDHKYLNPEEKEKAEANGNEGEDGEECPVCLGPITLPLSLQCGHVFCMVCVKGIANTTKNCAICRRDIQRDMLMDIRFCREEDIIKNYVNNPKYKKTTRSKSVPNRRVGVTTRDYDDMVSALMSTRTSSSNYRYQRPNNGHTPPSYTPYCYATSSFANTTTSTQPSQNSRTNTTSSNFYDDDCCCVSPNLDAGKKSELQISYKQTQQSPKQSTPVCSVPTSIPSKPSVVTTSSFAKPSTTSANNQTSAGKKSGNVEKGNTDLQEKSLTSSAPPIPGRPRRPTSLALQSSSSTPSTAPEPDAQYLSQEEYDRWLAFQLAKAEDEVSASEFNKIHRNPFRRSMSMPDRKELQDDKQFDEHATQSKTDAQIASDAQSKLPPTSPRFCSTTTTSVNLPSSTSNARVTTLSKSSSDSNASHNNPTLSANSAMSTGARPKSSTGLKKRVSFKEDSPPVRRKAPVMLPCEFCDEIFPERDLMRHQTSCDHNETKNPREYLLARRSSVTSPVTAPNSPKSPTSPSAMSGYVSSSKPPYSPLNRSSESPAKTSIRTLKTPPHSPSLRPRPPPSPITPPRSPSSSSTSPMLGSGISEGYDSAFNSRNNSVSPGLTSSSGTSRSGASSGVSSISSSSASTTPSTSSSASPIPATTQPDTPTDIEADIEEEEAPFPRPRKGRLLSSAIISWRSISGGKTPNKERPKYARSNTAPIQVNKNLEEETNIPTQGVTNSRSASHIKHPQLMEDSDDESYNPLDSSDATKTAIFKRNKNKYPAPPPPVVSEGRICTPVIPKEEKSLTSKRSLFKFDSVPVMNGQQLFSSSDVIPCEFCKEVFQPEKFRNHQAVCEADSENSQSPNHSTNEQSRNDGNTSQSNNIPKRSKGPAPQPPQEIEIPKRKPIERSHSVRESSSGERRTRKESDGYSRRLERASSIKETSRYSRSSCESSPSRWMSREGVYSSSLDLSAAYSGGASLTSSCTSLNNYSGGSGWSSHVNMIRDDVRSRRPATTLGGSSSPSHLFFGTSSRYLDRSSRYRPSSLYSSSIRSSIYI